MTEGWEIETATTLEEIERLRDVWQGIQLREPFPQINADHDRFVSLLKSKGEGVQPHVMLIKNNGQLITIVAGWIKTLRIDFQIGYLTLLRPRLRCFSIVYGGIIGEQNNEAVAVVIKGFEKISRSGKIDFVYLNHLRTDSCTYMLSKKMPGILCRDYFVKVEPHLRIPVSGTFEQFMGASSKNRRKHVSKYIKRLERDYSGRFKFVTYTKEDDLDEAIKAAASISSNTYQQGMNVGFEDNSKNRELLAFAARNHWLRFDILYIDGQPCAFRRALKYGNVCFGEQIGYSPQWKDYNVGTILFLKVVESLCNDPNVDYYDFGFGGGKHKEWSNYECWDEATCLIFAPRLYPILINMIRICIRFVESMLEFSLRKTGLRARIKRHWRNRLEVKASEPVT